MRPPNGMRKRQASYMARKANPPPAVPSELLAHLPVGERSAIRVSIDGFPARRYGNVRVWYRRRRGRTWFPTPRGLVLPLELLPEVIRALQLGCDRLRSERVSRDTPPEEA